MPGSWDAARVRGASPPPAPFSELRMRWERAPLRGSAVPLLLQSSEVLRGPGGTMSTGAADTGGEQNYCCHLEALRIDGQVTFKTTG